MSKNVTGRPCPFEDCGSSDAFSWSPEKHVGKCFSCDRGYPAKGGVYKDWAHLRYPLKEDVDNTPVRTVLTDWRGIRKDIFELFGVVTRVNVDGDVVEQSYTYPSGAVKVRSVPKAFRTVGNVSRELFGADRFPKGCGKKVTVTEGELDAMSAYQMINNEQSPYVNPVVSLPSASPSNEFWTNAKNYFDGFEEIILSVDTDGPGNAIADRICSIFPAKTKRVDHGDLKDANEFLKAGRVKDYVNLWFGAATYTPDNIYNTEQDFIALYDEDENLEYVPTGVSEFDNKLLGIIPGHFYVFKAATGIGKSEFFRYLENQFIERGVKFAACHLEEVKLRSILGLCGYHLKRNVTRKDLIIAQDLENEVKGSIKTIADKELYFQFALRENESVESLLELVRLLSIGYGCRFIFIEPIQDVLTNVNADTKETELTRLAVAFSKLAAELNIAILTIAHTNVDGDVKYAKSIAQRASVVVDLDRDKDSTEDLTRNTLGLTCVKNRPTSLEGYAGKLLFDLQSFTMSPRRD